jgi:hypothetical protein
MERWLSSLQEQWKQVYWEKNPSTKRDLVAAVDVANMSCCVLLCSICIVLISLASG